MKLKMLLLFLGFWLGASVIVDFVGAPSIFRNVSSLQEAGTLGMVMFKSLNTLEVILSLSCFVLAIFLIKEEKLKRSWIVVYATMMVLTFVFRFYMTPSIIDINRERWELAESSKRYEVLKKEHNFYHKLYVKLEGGKLILVVAAVVGLMRLREEQAI